MPKWQRKDTCPRTGAFLQNIEKQDYFLFAFAFDAGAFVAGFALVLTLTLVAGFTLLPMLVAGATFVAGAMFVAGATFTGATFAGLAGVLFAGASPQAIPRAPITRTVESKITFFILFFKLLSFLKD